jgi:S-formylglutathione hydrolase
LLFNNFSLDKTRQSITGHSMGGHGALTIALTFPDTYCSVSAFSPITNPANSDWGIKQFNAYLGKDKTKWQAHDATVLMKEKGFPGPILIDQGSSDQFWDLLSPGALSDAIIERKQAATFRIHEGYDHSYFFISSFIEDHISFHAEALYR